MNQHCSGIGGHGQLRIAKVKLIAQKMMGEAREREKKRKLLSFKAETNCKAEEKECSAVCSKCR
jgi:hypothetical protein